MSEEKEIIWKQRYEKLKADICDLVESVDGSQLEKMDHRVHCCMEYIYVSYDLDVVHFEKKAIELWGPGKYDIYRLWKSGDGEEGKLEK